MAKIIDELIMSSDPLATADLYLTNTTVVVLLEDKHEKLVSAYRKFKADSEKLAERCKELETQLTEQHEPKIFDRLTVKLDIDTSSASAALSSIEARVETLDVKLDGLLSKLKQFGDVSL